MSKDITESVWRIYETINDWIRFSDTKAGAILAANGVIAGVVLALLPEPIHLENSILIIACLGLVTGILSSYFSMRCLNPTLKIGESNSLIYFSNIAQKFNSPSEYINAFNETFINEDAILSQFAEQIWTNSRVAQKKYVAVSWATRFFGLTIFLIIIGIVVSWF